ncbi:MAG: MoaD/ThiS family protein [Fuerstiella sp.]
MNVVVEFEAELRTLAGTEQRSVAMSTTATVLSTLQAAVQESDDALRSRIFADDGQLRSSLLIFVNDQPLPAGTGAATELADGDHLLLLPPISGG